MTGNPLENLLGFLSELDRLLGSNRSEVKVRISANDVPHPGVPPPLRLGTKTTCRDTTTIAPALKRKINSSPQRH